MNDFDVREECPHCDAAPPSHQLDIHVARTHADLPPCTARIEPEHGGLYTCAFRAGHEKGEYSHWHASKRNGAMGSRYVWNDSATGARSHRPPQPSHSLDGLQAMGILSHTVVAAADDSVTGKQQPEPERDCGEEDSRPEPPTEGEQTEGDQNPALPVQPDPRQPAYDAVYEYIRALGDYLPPDPRHRNAIIWRAVQAALDATPVGRCVSSHCVEGDHMIFNEGGWDTP